MKQSATWRLNLPEFVTSMVQIRGGVTSAKCTNEENYLMMNSRAPLRGQITSTTVHGFDILPRWPVWPRAFGSGAMTNSIPDIEAADCILIGGNTTETHPLIASRIFKAKRARR